jgi:hypothetical protein
MWLQITEYSERMNNLKTRIKRRKESPKKSHPAEPSSTSVGADWQFVNFNPIFYGANNRRSIACPLEYANSGVLPNTSALDDSCNNAPLEQNQQQSNHNRLSTNSSSSACGPCESSEDFYEFPTSTKLNLSSSTAPTSAPTSNVSNISSRSPSKDISPSSTTANSNRNSTCTDDGNHHHVLSSSAGDQAKVLLEEAQSQRRTKDLRDLLLETQTKNKHQRRSLNAAFDLMIPPYPGGGDNFEELNSGHVAPDNKDKDKSSHHQQDILRIKKGHSKSNPNPPNNHGSRSGYLGGGQRPHSGIGLVSFMSSGAEPPPPPPPPRPPGLIKSNSVLSSSSSSSITSSSASFTSGGGDGSNPVSRSSSRGKESSQTRSTFYYIAPALPPKGSGGNNITLLKGPPPPPPPPYPSAGLKSSGKGIGNGGNRPHSWDLDALMSAAGKSTGSRRLPFLQDVVDHHKKKKRTSFYHYGKKKDKLVISGGNGNNDNGAPPPLPPALKPKKFGAQIPLNLSSSPQAVALNSGVTGNHNVTSPLVLMTSANASNNGSHHYHHQHHHSSNNNPAAGNLCFNLSRIST